MAKGDASQEIIAHSGDKTMPTTKK